MNIDIEQTPPTMIPQLRWKYTRASLFFLSLVLGAIVLGVIGIFFDTGYDDILQNTAFFLFVVSGFAFVYFSEKLLGFRRLAPRQEKKLVELAQEHDSVSEYWRKVAEQGRYIVVNEYEAIVAYTKNIREEKSK